MLTGCELFIRVALNIMMTEMFSGEKTVQVHSRVDILPVKFQAPYGLKN